MTRWAIQCVARAGPVTIDPTFDPSGHYMSGGNVDAHDGRGYATWTEDIHEALPFDDSGDAFRFWQRQSRVRPLRDDGKPNRPLTAFSITLVEIPSTLTIGAGEQ